MRQARIPLQAESRACAPLRAESWLPQEHQIGEMTPFLWEGALRGTGKLLLAAAARLPVSTLTESRELEAPAGARKARGNEAGHSATVVPLPRSSC